MFQVKSFTSIVASMVNRIRSTTHLWTDFNIGSIGRTLIEAPAQELDEYYQQVLAGLTEAIPVSVYTSFAFSLLPASAANGLIRVSATSSSSAVTIPAGTVFTTPNTPIAFASTADATIAAGNTYVDVHVAATTAGMASNLIAGQIFRLSFVPVGFVSAINALGYTNGTDLETEDQRKIRFQAYISTLARAPVAGIEYGLRTTVVTDSVGNVIEKVAFAKVVEPYVTDSSQPPSLVNGYIHNGVGSTSNALIAAAQTIIFGYTDPTGNKVPGYKAAGVVMVIMAATEVVVNVTATMSVLIPPGSTEAAVVAQATQAVSAYILGLTLGASCELSKIYQVAMETPGVTNFIPTLPGSDTAAAANVKLMPGTISITGL